MPTLVYNVKANVSCDPEPSDDTAELWSGGSYIRMCAIPDRTNCARASDSVWRIQKA